MLRANRQSGFELLLSEEIAVILLDVNMPGMDGFEAAEMIRQHPLHENPHHLCHGREHDRFLIVCGYEISAVDYVSVPVIPEILRAKVSVFVELHRKTRQLERANQSLVEAEQRMRAILETANDAIVTVDASGVIQTTNAAAERIFGYEADELIGKNVDMLVPSPWRTEFSEALGGQQAAGNGALNGTNREFQGLRKDGAIVPLEVAVSEAVPGKMFTGIIRDTSRRKQLEREVTEVAAAEQRRIGQELHDGVSQELTGLVMMATARAFEKMPRRSNQLDNESSTGFATCKSSSATCPMA